MPATENVWRNLPGMHRVFAVSSLALLGATLLMFRSDYADEWRKIQAVNYKLQTQLIDTDLAQLNSAQFAEKTSELEARLTAATQLVEDRKQELDVATAEASKIDGEFQKLSQEVRFKRAERDVRRAAYDLAVRDMLPGTKVRPLREQFNEAQALVDDLEAKLQVLEGRFATALARKSQVTKERDAAAGELKKHRVDRDRLLAARDKIAPTGGKALKRWLMELPVVEGFNGPLKINQIWLPKLEINYGGMTNVARFDRCTTCHLNIDRVGAGNLPAFPHDPDGISPENAEDYISGKKKRIREDGSVVGYAHPYSTHPKPELYLTSASPHPLQKFGCTGCHDGCGSGTSFQNSSHAPNSPDVGEKWATKYGYAANHYWEYPMFPKRLAEAACVKCHHNVVELGANPKFGTTAPKLIEGYSLISEYGCFGCHEINGYNAGKPIGPDLRLEPQTEDEAERIANDPAAVAGTQRKVGPGLRHFAAKATRGWAEGWVRDPKEFRPATRMPQFFHLSNLKDGIAQMLQPVEIAGIVEYLLAKSQPLDTEEWAADYQPNAERGRVLFAQRGCLACHAHEEFPGSTSDFGPNLTQVHKKIPSAKWLYTWVRNPAKHSARTRMPNLYLEPEVVQGTTVDPAADIAAWLLSKGPEQYPETELKVFLGADLDKRFTAETARRLQLSEPRGVRVIAVVPHSPAARAAAVTEFSNEIINRGNNDLFVDKPALQPDDVILTWGGEAVNSPAEVEQRLQSAAVDSEVELVIWRDGAERKVRVTLEKPLLALTRMNLVKVLTGDVAEQVMRERVYPAADAERLRSSPVQPDEIELVDGKIDDTTLLRYVGRRTISRYGCYGCHDIPGFEKARPIGTALQDWGRKDPTKLALEHIEEYLHYHGEPDGSSTLERAAKALENGVNDRFSSPEEAESESRAAYFVDQLLHHGRGGFLWQKLRNPRSYDFKKVETKGYDERLRMPKFPFDERQIEAIATFVLGLTAEPPAEEYVYRPQGADKARIDGEKLITRFNCASCHLLELPAVTFAANAAEYRIDLTDEQRDQLTQGEAIALSGQERWKNIREYLESGTPRIYARDVDPRVLETIELNGLDVLAKTIRAAAPAKPAVHVDTKLITGLHDRLWTKFASGFGAAGDGEPVVPEASGESFYRQFNGFIETLSVVESTPVDHPQAFDSLMKLKPPQNGLVGPGSTQAEVLVKFHGLVNSVPDPEDDPADQEFGYDLWETLQVGNKTIVPSSRVLVPALKKIASDPGRGGDFAEWLTNFAMSTDRQLDRSKARQMTPPPLYQEGVKVQTPWLYSFLKNPGKIRYTTLLRMPQFTLSDAEAQTLANYFAAVDGSSLPYQPVPQRDPGYLAAMERSHANYLEESWKLLTLPPPTGLCAGCHSVGGREFVAGDPTKVVRGPNLENVTNRLQPDWVELWIYNPKWITAYTSMPQNFPAGKEQFPELLGGDGQKQSVGSRDALMNYLRMLERKGPPPPAAASAPPVQEGQK